MRVSYFCNLILSNFIRVDAGDANTLSMHGQHDLDCRDGGLVKHVTQHTDHEVHRGVVVVVQEHFIEAGFINTFLGLGEDSSALLGVAVAFPIWHGISLSQLGQR